MTLCLTCILHIEMFKECLPSADSDPTESWIWHSSIQKEWEGWESRLRLTLPEKHGLRLPDEHMTLGRSPFILWLRFLHDKEMDQFGSANIYWEVTFILEIQSYLRSTACTLRALRTGGTSSQDKVKGNRMWQRPWPELCPGSSGAQNRADPFQCARGRRSAG